MPELPEVETTRRGIAPRLEQQIIKRIDVRQSRLRWPIPDEVQGCVGEKLGHISRRGKYLILPFSSGSLLWHLGMSGHMRTLQNAPAPGKHDHVDLVFESGTLLRYTDPRRFGALLFAREPLEHPLLASLGPEPLSDAFNDDYLKTRFNGKKQSVKQAIMDSHIVPGVGNIYASESLFRSRIHPATAAGKLSRQRLERLVMAIKDTLTDAIAAGGTSLRDFAQADGKPGYFKQALRVYGRAGEACPICSRAIKQKTLGQRASYYCGHCQR